MDDQAKDPHSWPAGETGIEGRRELFGQKLRAAREAKNISTQALSQSTRISINFIEALECGAMEKLPGAVFGRGFVRNIAKTIGADSDAYLAEFTSLWDRPEPTSVLKVQIKNKPGAGQSDAWVKSVATTRGILRRGSALKVIFPVAVVGLVALALGFGAGRIKNVPWAKYLHATSASITAVETPAPPAHVTQLDLTPPPAEAPRAAAAAEPDSVASSPPPAETKTEEQPIADKAVETPAEAVEGAAKGTDQVLELTVTEPVRVRIDVDSGSTVTKELAPDTYRFSFNKKADLLIYDAAALKISYNGRALGTLGSKGRVRRLSFLAEPETSKKL